MTFSGSFLLLNFYFLSHKVILCESGSFNGRELFPELASDSELCSYIHANWALRHPLKKYCISSVDTSPTLLRYLVHCLGFLYVHILLNTETIYLPTWDTSVSHFLLPLQAEPTCPNLYLLVSSLSMQSPAWSRLALWEKLEDYRKGCVKERKRMEKKHQLGGLSNSLKCAKAKAGVGCGPEGRLEWTADMPWGQEAKAS